MAHLGEYGTLKFEMRADPKDKDFFNDYREQWVQKCLLRPNHSYAALARTEYRAVRG